MAAPGGTLNCEDFLMFQVKALLRLFFFFNYMVILSNRSPSLGACSCFTHVKFISGKVHTLTGLTMADL